MRIMRAASDEGVRFLGELRGRVQAVPAQVEAAVRSILDDVRTGGDAALCAQTERLDGVRLTPETIRVPEAALAAALSALEAPVRAALELAAERIEAFHRHGGRKAWSVAEPGVGVLGQLVRPLDRVGIYVPGGTAAYPSSVLMNALPAHVAGVPEIVMCTPAGRSGTPSPAVLAAAHLAGVREVYRVGGAQAVAAMAYGTATIRPVDKIVGPGNLYVATAKRLVYGVVGIDMVAGPSEVVVVADESARPAWVAADLLAQAEHDPLAAAICLTPSPSTAEAVAAEVERQLSTLPRREVAARAVAGFGAVLVTADLTEAIRLVNQIAPEHVELQVADPEAQLSAVRHAGAVFLGAHSPEAAGDYLAGPNHVLPTAGTARFGSPLTVEDFQARSSLINLEPQALRAWEEAIVALARAEGLEAHARSVTIRRESA
jgi:histidinol dehydrogenase